MGVPSFHWCVLVWLIGLISIIVCFIDIEWYWDLSESWLRKIRPLALEHVQKFIVNNEKLSDEHEAE
jgi:hypothetical protein